MNKERAYKSGTILTDGKHLIYLGLAYPRDWTPANNYGRKYTDYSSCRTYPEYKGAFVGDVRVFLEAAGGRIPGLWLQEGYHLQNFRPISKTLINQDILRNITK